MRPCYPTEDGACWRGASSCLVTKTFAPASESNDSCRAGSFGRDTVEGMKRWSHHVDGKALPHAHCRYCDQEIVEAPDIGWLDPDPGDTYDLCPSSSYGDHEPTDARGDANTSYGPVL